MAIGVPTNKKEKKKKNDLTLHLTYSNKKSVNDVMKTPKSKLVNIWGKTEKDANTQNFLFYGDNLPIMAKLLDNRKIAGKVRLVYIDPPYSTQTAFHSRKLSHAYEDNLTGAEFIEFLRARLILLRELLAEDGSIYLHLDEKMVFHIKVIMDEIFGLNNYKNCIVRKKCNPKNYTRKKYGNISDYILFYTKSDQYVWNRPIEPWTEDRALKEYQYIEGKTGRRYKKVPIHAPGVRNGETGKPWRGMLPPPGKHWQYTPQKLDILDAEDKIYWSPNGNPRRKVYLDENPGVSVQDIWLDYRDAHNQNIKITGYPTEKNPELLKRIIEASSNPDDIVLDCFCGSGTTLEIAHRLGRRWIGIDNSIEAMRTVLDRFAKGTEMMGDFVSKRKNKNQLPSLFEPIECEIEQGTKASKHRPIKNFSLIADVKCARDIEPVVDEWIKHQR